MPSFVARIKPDSPRLTHNTQGIRFARAEGWYTVTPDQAKKLKEIRLHERGEDETKVFDVKTPEAAQALLKTEKRLARQAGTPTRPIDPQRGPDLGPDHDGDDDEVDERDPESTRDRRPSREDIERAGLDADRTAALLDQLEAVDQRMRKIESDNGELERKNREQHDELARLRRQLDQESNRDPAERGDAKEKDAPKDAGPATRPGTPTAIAGTPAAKPPAPAAEEPPAAAPGRPKPGAPKNQ